MTSLIFRGVVGAGAAGASVRHPIRRPIDISAGPSNGPCLVYDPSYNAKYCFRELVRLRKCISRGHLFVCGNASAEADDPANRFSRKSGGQAKGFSPYKQRKCNAATSKFDDVDLGSNGGAQQHLSNSSARDTDDRLTTEGGGSDDNGKYGGGDGGGGGSGDGSGEERSDDEESFGPILNAEQVQQELRGKGVTLPPDMMEAVKTAGIRKLLLSRYLDLQGAPWPLGPAIRSNSLLRNRMLADPSFLFKVFTEIAIDSGCATFAEVQKRGKDFWNEFELYMSDLSVGVVLDIALVGLLAPFVQFGAVTSGSGRRAQLSRAIQALPSSMFEAQRPGRVFLLHQRIGTLFFKAIQYGVAGFTCGVVGQGIASSVMTLKRKLRKTEEEEVKVPSIMKSAVLWAVFMAVSSNTRYQVINGLERVVEGSVLTRRVPQLSMAFTVGIRFANNIYGGMQFVDWARWAGVQ